MENFFSEIKEAERFEQIISVLMKKGLKGFIEKTSDKKQGGRIAPKLIRETLEELGGSFIKLGQFLSLRPDLIPHEYCVELEKLQDEVKPFSSTRAKQIIRESIAKPLHEVFKHIDKKPLAAASIGQVYRAILSNGEEVAIKVMRPGIKEKMRIDILILFHLAHIISKHINEEVIDLQEIVEEFRKYTEEELNYLGEMQNLQTVHDNFKTIPNVIIPKPHKELCSERVLTMQYLEGVPLNKIMSKLSKNKRNHLAKQLTHIVLKQIFIDGFFHADMHPGNILVMTNNKIGILDFGIIGVINDDVKEELTILLISLINKDLDGIINAMAKLHFFPNNKEIDKEKLKEDLRITLGPYYDVEVGKIDISSLFIQSLEVARNNQLRVPKDLVLLGKATITLQGVTRDLDKNFDMLTVVKPFITELISNKINIKTLIKKTSEEAINLKEFLVEVPEMTKQYFYTTNKIEVDLRSMNNEISSLTMIIKKIQEETIFFFLIIFFSITAHIMRNQGPFIIGIPFFSATLILIIIFLIIRLLKKK